MLENAEVEQDGVHADVVRGPAGRIRSRNSPRQEPRPARRARLRKRSTKTGHAAGIAVDCDEAAASMQVERGELHMAPGARRPSTTACPGWSLDQGARASSARTGTWWVALGREAFGDILPPSLPRLPSVHATRRGFRSRESHDTSNHDVALGPGRASQASRGSSRGPACPVLPPVRRRRGSGAGSCAESRLSEPSAVRLAASSTISPRVTRAPPAVHPTGSEHETLQEGVSILRPKREPAFLIERVLHARRGTRIAPFISWTASRLQVSPL